MPRSRAVCWGLNLKSTPPAHRLGLSESNWAVHSSVRGCYYRVSYTREGCLSTLVHKLSTGGGLAGTAGRSTLARTTPGGPCVGAAVPAPATRFGACARGGAVLSVPGVRVGLTAVSEE